MPRKSASPLWLHMPSGHCCKKHRGKVYYFGIDQKAAEEDFRHRWPDILAGREARPKREDGPVTIRELCNAFLTAKHTKMDIGKLSVLTFTSF